MCFAMICVSSRPSECELEYDTGPCRGMFKLFYFNATANKCEQFTYGGCQGRE